MATRWNTTDDIARAFDMAPGTDVGSIRTQLRKCISELHPDRSGGSFRSEADKTKYLEATDAIEQLDAWEQTSQALVPIAHLPAVIAALSDALAPRNAADSLSLHTAAIEDARTRLSRIYAGPKIGSGAFAAVAAFLFGFSDKLSNNPILGPLFSSNAAHLLLLSVAAYSGVFFVMAWIRERQAEARAEYIMSESALDRIFTVMLDLARRNDPPTYVSSDQVKEAVQRVGGVRPGPMRVMSLGVLLDLPTIEKAASIQIQRLIERKVLTRIDRRSIQTWYEIHA